MWKYSFITHFKWLDHSFYEITRYDDVSELHTELTGTKVTKQILKLESSNYLKSKAQYVLLILTRHKIFQSLSNTQ